MATLPTNAGGKAHPVAPAEADAGVTTDVVAQAPWDPRHAVKAIYRLGMRAQGRGAPEIALRAAQLAAHASYAIGTEARFIEIHDGLERALQRGRRLDELTSHQIEQLLASPQAVRARQRELDERLDAALLRMPQAMPDRDIYYRQLLELVEARRMVPDFEIYEDETTRRVRIL